MANILITPFFFSSVLNAGLTVGRRLREAGHHVTFACIADQEAKVRQADFSFLPLLPKTHPKGALDALEGFRPSNQKHLIRHLTDYRRRVHDELVTWGLGPDFHRGMFDLLIGSSDAPEVTIAGGQLVSRLAHYSLTPVPLESLGLPPLGGGLYPKPGLVYPLMRFRDWRWVDLQRIILRMMGGDDHKRMFLDLARRTNFDARMMKFDVDFAPVRLTIPHLILWPSILDFPGVRDPEQTYRLESASEPKPAGTDDFPWDSLPLDKPLIYCGLGVTGTFAQPGLLEKVFGAFLKAMAERPQWCGVLSVGKSIQLPPREIPPNVIVREHVPQLKILERSSLFVTQAGPVSMSEAAVLGVPMVAIPLFHDHFAMAVRMAVRGLALYARHDECSKLGQWMDQVMGDASARERAKQTADQLRDLIRQKLTAKAVDEILGLPIVSHGTQG